MTIEKLMNFFPEGIAVETVVKVGAGRPQASQSPPIGKFF
jgi:hypothetical protein